MMNARNKPPFTATQWQELENQALIFKHMVSNVPIPPELLFPLKRSWDSSDSSKLFPHNQSMGWGCFHMGLGRKIDPEPGRCRRTDGKKWRCSKEAFPDSKYCEKHMHRGRNRSRKPVEVITTTQSKPMSSFNTNTTTTTTNTNPSFSLSSSMNNTETHHHNHPYYNASLPSFLYPHSSSSRPPGFGFSPQTNTTHFVSDSGSYSQAENDYRSVQGLKEGLDERSFFSEPSGSLRNVPDLSLDNSWKFTPLRMSSSSSFTQPKENNNCYSALQNGYSQQQYSDISGQQNKHQQEQHCFVLGTDFKSERPVKVDKQEEPQQPLRHFFDEWPLKSRESWMNMEEERLNRASFSTTQLSISIPEPSSDFAVSSYSKW
ncbi:WRC [Macleaya cordata]|uniref:Growth-regulating factor n=1 Tax=Macleaya cordata TaxID=56857 RepID=A0A200QCY9_MACCD|nr:WRC [Macleaya cordata]